MRSLREELRASQAALTGQAADGAASAGGGAGAGAGGAGAGAGAGTGAGGDAARTGAAAARKHAASKTAGGANTAHATASTATDAASSLPLESLLNVYSFLGMEDHLRARLVCKHFATNLRGPSAGYTDWTVGVDVPAPWALLGLSKSIGHCLTSMTLDPE